MNNLSGNSERARHFGEALPELKRIPRCGLDVVVDWLTDTLPKQRVGNCRVNNPSQRASHPSDASSEPLASEQSLRSSGRANGPPPSPAMASPVPASRHSLFHHRSRSTSRKRHPHRSLIARFASARVQFNSASVDELLGAFVGRHNSVGVRKETVPNNTSQPSVISNMTRTGRAWLAANSTLRAF